MRPFYFLLYISLPYSLRLFYRRVRNLNRPKQKYSSTIYVSNHPNSFMDPLVIGSENNAVVFFMTRSDVFVWWLKPVLWASHMLPIFRQHDGENTKKANTRVFEKVNKVLARGRNILIFGEGFTDDVPIRSLKSVKKGGVRMGFSALDALGWDKHTIYVQAVGINYTARNIVGSDLLVDNGNPICLNDFREAYEQNPNKTTAELTKRLEQEMRGTVTFVAEKSWFSFHEQIMNLNGKGMNHDFVDNSRTLEERHAYSQSLAHYVNEHAEDPVLTDLKEKLDAYFRLCRKMKAPQWAIAGVKHPELLKASAHLAYVLLLWPFALLGLIHGFIPYFAAKKITEKAFGRKVFWGSVKMLLGMIFGGLYNIPLVIVLNAQLIHNGWISVVYFLLVPLFCRIAYGYFRQLKLLMAKRKVVKDVDKLKSLSGRREQLLAEIRQAIPVA